MHEENTTGLSGHGINHKPQATSHKPNAQGCLGPLMAQASCPECPWVQAPVECEPEGLSPGGLESRGASGGLCLTCRVMMSLRVKGSIREQLLPVLGFYVQLLDRLWPHPPSKAPSIYTRLSVLLGGCTAVLPPGCTDTLRDKTVQATYKRVPRSTYKDHRVQAPCRHCTLHHTLSRADETSTVDWVSFAMGAWQERRTVCAGVLRPALRTGGMLPLTS